jgi:hypothetical protein
MAWLCGGLGGLRPFRKAMPGQKLKFYRKFYEVESQKALDVRSRMAALQTQLKGLMIERDQADEAQAALFVSVSNSIRGNPEFGLNSPLYRSLGFVPKMERKRPKRASKKETAAPPVDSPAGADAV